MLHYAGISTCRDATLDPRRSCCGCDETAQKSSQQAFATHRSAAPRTAASGRAFHRPHSAASSAAPRQSLRSASIGFTNEAASAGTRFAARLTASKMIATPKSDKGSEGDSPCKRERKARPTNSAIGTAMANASTAIRTRDVLKLIDVIDRRLSQLLRWPIEKSEPLHVLRYMPGAEYKPHHDYFPPEFSGSGPHIKRGGNRIGTLIIYLNDCKSAGHTIFPDLGLAVLPRRGFGVFFTYDRPHPSTLS